jgi:Raf kinase inhibitor-like YbhB/YbcL family protein
MIGRRQLAVTVASLAVVASCAPASSLPPATNEAAAATPSSTATVAAASTDTTPTVSPAATESTMPFTLTSTAFKDGDAIPRKFSCDGQNVSPALEWAGVPDGAASLALIVDDPDANGFVHWVVFDMTASQSGGLPEAVSSSPDAPPQGTNGRGQVGWTGPCPPSGTHRYTFTLMALDSALELTGAPKADEVRRAAEGHVVDEAVLTGTFKRG